MVFGIDPGMSRCVVTHETADAIHQTQFKGSPDTTTAGSRLDSYTAHAGSIVEHVLGVAAGRPVVVGIEGLSWKSEKQSITYNQIQTLTHAQLRAAGCHTIQIAPRNMVKFVVGRGGNWAKDPDTGRTVDPVGKRDVIEVLRPLAESEGLDWPPSPGRVDRSTVADLADSLGIQQMTSAAVHGGQAGCLLDVGPPQLEALERLAPQVEAITMKETTNVA